MTTALVIEDNENNLELIGFILKSHGYQYLWAETGCEGLEMALREKPDFILLDIQLPDIDGREALRRLRQTEFGGNVPVIAITSFAMPGDREALLSAGCNGYLEKPIEAERVMRLIQQVLGEV